MTKEVRPKDRKEKEKLIFNCICISPLTMVIVTKQLNNKNIKMNK